MGYAARLFLLFSFPCSADHERDWPPFKVVFFGLATNTLNVRNNNKHQQFIFFCINEIRLEHSNYALKVFAYFARAELISKKLFRCIKNEEKIPASLGIFYFLFAHSLHTVG